MRDCWLCLEPIEGPRINGGYPDDLPTDAPTVLLVSHPQCFVTYRPSEAERVAQWLGDKEAAR